MARNSLRHYRSQTAILDQHPQVRAIKPLLLSLAILLLGIGNSVDAQTNNSVKPYVARYHVKYRGMSGGDIEFTLKSLGNGRYAYSSHLLPNFLGSLFASEQAEDSSIVSIDNNGVRPLQFRSEDGTGKTEKDQRYDFDWSKQQVSGHYKNRDFVLDVPLGVQERLSIQLAATLALQAGREPGKLIMLERDELQEYHITHQGNEQVHVSAGSYDTLVLKSERTGSTRSTRYWYAAKLGYIPVRAERTTKGKVDIVMELKSYQAL